MGSIHIHGRGRGVYAYRGHRTYQGTVIVTIWGLLGKGKVIFICCQRTVVFGRLVSYICRVPFTLQVLRFVVDSGGLTSCGTMFQGGLVMGGRRFTLTRHHDDLGATN